MGPSHQDLPLSMLQMTESTHGTPRRLGSQGKGLPWLHGTSEKHLTPLVSEVSRRLDG